MKIISLPIGDGHSVTGSEDDILALQALLNERRNEGRSIGKAEAEDEIQRLRTGIRQAKEAFNDSDNYSDTVWAGPHITMYEHLDALLDPGPEARGEIRIPGLELVG